VNPLACKNSTIASFPILIWEASLNRRVPCDADIQPGADVKKILKNL
jgi:hypothetical protein